MTPDNKLLKPLGNGKMILSEKQVLEDIAKVPAPENSPNTIKSPEPEQISNHELNLEAIAGIVAEESELKGETNTQDVWVENYNKMKRIYSSIPNYYNTAKAGNQAKTLEKIQKDANEKWINSSTRIEYNKENLEGTIIHNYKSNFAKEIRNNCKIPVYSWTLIKDVLSTGEGLYFMQLLLNTKDNAQEIIKNIETLSGRKSENIYLHTPDQDSRNNNPVRAPLLVDDNDSFRVVCYNFLVSDGRSRGVR